MNRSSGILMPIFSIPNKYGIGTFGKKAYDFVDFLKNSKVHYWQVLPMHPLTYGNSPYQSTSSFAGNQFFIDLDMLYDEGYLKKKDYDKLDYGKDTHRIDYEKVRKEKKPVLIKAAKNFIEKNENKKDDFIEFKNKFKYFLDDYVVYDLLKDRYDYKPFCEWDKIHKFHYEEVIKEFLSQNEEELESYRVIQYFFFIQWMKLKKYANDNNIKIIGDMPIYSSLDSAEVFSNYKNFLLDENRSPKVVAGCPPDAFSSTGQLWGNPIYDYDYMKKDNYKYFVNRIKHLSTLYDVIRIDHFRGFASYYEIPAKDTTAQNGVWKKGPGIELFNEFNRNIKDLHIIAEDLGYIDEPVRKLLSDTGYPGMKVVEFAFDSCDIEHHEYLPINYNENSVAYLGTHDNDTFMGWFKLQDDDKKKNIIKYLNIDNEKKANIYAIKELYKSKSNLTIILMQDLLGLDSNSRINTPSTVSEKNWSYRFDDNFLKKYYSDILKDIIESTDRDN